MHESGGSWFYHHAECCELRCRCILHSRRRSYPRSCLPPLVVPVHSRSNRLVALSRSGCPTHAMTAPFPIEQPHSPLFDPRGLPHAEAARASNPENERMDQHHHVCENATDMYSESCVAITAAQHGDDPHRPCVYTLDERARERTSRTFSWRTSRLRRTVVRMTRVKLHPSCRQSLKVSASSSLSGHGWTHSSWTRSRGQ